jgi:hypothetical protein
MKCDDCPSHMRGLGLTCKMPRFITGDELGNIKSLRYSVGVVGDAQVELKTIIAGAILDGRPNAVQALAVVAG